jgi:hypothetical protein
MTRLGKYFRCMQLRLAENSHVHNITRELVREAYSKMILKVLGEERLAEALRMYDLVQQQQQQQQPTTPSGLSSAI